MSGEGLLPNNPRATEIEDDGFITVHPPIQHFSDQRFASRPPVPLRERVWPTEWR